MDNTWFIYYLLLMIIILYLPWKRRKRYAAKRIMKKGKINNSQRSAGKIMRELAERFIGKDVYINLLDGRADGVIKEVTVVKLREYPHNKKGKRSTIMDM